MLAERKGTDELYAIKILKLDNPQNNANTLALIKQEVESTTNFNHQHIVKYYRFKEESTYHRSNG